MLELALNGRNLVEWICEGMRSYRTDLEELRYLCSINIMRWLPRCVPCGERSGMEGLCASHQW